MFATCYEMFKNTQCFKSKNGGPGNETLLFLLETLLFLQTRWFSQKKTYNFNLNCVEPLRLSTFFRTVPLAMYGFVRTAFDMRFGRWAQGLWGFSIHSLAAVPLLTIRCDA